MKLTIEQIKKITKGAVHIEEVDGRIAFFRFTKEQEEAYSTWDADFYKKTFATAGIKLEFYTDSTSLFIKTRSRPAASRRFLANDIFVDGRLVGQVGASFEDCEAAPDYSYLSGRFELGEGKKRVCVFLPWAFSSQLCELSLDDGASLEPTQSKIKMIMFGDSITHGYDATSPSNAYSVRLAALLEADAVNKAIGGEKFRPELAAMHDGFEPDIITVAYGTNDWNSSSKETFDRDCKCFYDNLAKSYPNSKIFALTPIWRADINDKKDVGEFSYVSEYINKVTKEHKNITVIEGMDLVPHDTSLFSDKFLHPNDKGFDYYVNNLYKKLKELI